ncbi:UGSC family (seleno)protein [Neobacillus niacini]|uniref:UGSC family (seleno)protein n=1 Tax=Neobacillus niacini TaxID=86668 RepID=UPI0039834D62
MYIENLGIPTVTICSEAFYPLAKAEAEAKGMPELAIVKVPHPLGSVKHDIAEQYGRNITDEVLELLCREQDSIAVEAKVEDEYVKIDYSKDIELSFFKEVNDYFYQQHWTDGLPIIPPTKELVDTMLRFSNDPANKTLGEFPPQWSETTIEKVAVNAVMAGCEPKYFPVVLAAIRALLHPKFNLYALQATTNPVTPLLVINGPIAKQLGMNSKANVFGNGNKVNLTIGRAIRLCMINIGNALPGELDRATQGQPGKISFCIAENEEENPWEPYHVENKFELQESTVSVFGAAGTQNILDESSTSAQSLLIMIAGTMTGLGTNNLSVGGEVLIVLSPEHAQLIKDDGFSKKDVQKFLYDYARVPLSALPEETKKQLLYKRRPKWFLNVPDYYMAPIVDSPEDIKVIVAGSHGPHSTFIPSFGQASRTVTVPIET